MPIQISDGFHVGANVPIDDRFVQVDVTAIPSFLRYEGLIAFQSGTSSVGVPGTYQLVGGIADINWQALSGVSSTQPPSASLVYIGPVSGPPTGNLSPYERGKDSIVTPEFQIVVIKRTYPIASVQLLQDGNPVKIFDTTVDPGGIIPDGGDIIYNLSETLTATSVFQLVVTPTIDSAINSNAVILQFNYPTFWGVGPANMDASAIQLLNHKDLTYTVKPDVLIYP